MLLNCTSLQNSFSEQLRQANKDLRQVLQEADNRYVLLSNAAPKEHDALDKQATGRGTDDPLTQLLDMVVGMHHAGVSGEKFLMS